MINVMLADGFEEIEALTVVDVLRRANLNVNLVSCEKDQNVTGAHNIAVKADILLGECSLDEAQLIVLPGGMPGTLNLLENKDLIDFLTQAYQKNIKLAAICAAPMIFGKLGFLNGKSAVCYPGFEKDLVGATVPDTRVITDGNITTSKGPGTALEFAFHLVKWLGNAEMAEKLKGDMLAR